MAPMVYVCPRCEEQEVTAGSSATRHGDYDYASCAACGWHAESGDVPESMWGTGEEILLDAKVRRSMSEDEAERGDRLHDQMLTEEWEMEAWL